MDNTENENTREPLTRREREKAAHRREILDAAEKVFAEKGFERATVEEVARSADFSVGAIYNFFENKEVLWTEVITRIGKDFQEAFHRVTGSAEGPFEAISALIRLKLYHSQEHGPFLRVFMGTVSGNRVVPFPVNTQNCRCLYDEYIDEATALFRHAMDMGIIRKADPVFTVLTLEGIIHSFKAYWARRGMDFSLTEQAELIENHFLNPLRIQQGEQ